MVTHADLTEREPRRHIPALDGIRGIAILLVMVFHAGKMSAGWLGVDLFFVLSGFLITGILVRAKLAPRYFRNFIGRRVLRIFPPYYAYLLVALVILPALGLLPVPHGWGWAVTYLVTYPLARHGNWGLVPLGTQHLWSVAVEEQFYLLWPLVVWLVPARRLWLVCVAGIGGALAFRAGLYLVHWTGLASVVLTPSRMDSLLVGAFLALRPWRPPRAALVVAIGFLIAILVTGNPGTDPVQRVYGFTLLAIAGGTLLAGTMSEPLLARVFAWRPLRIAGKYSYTAYLVHFLIVVLLEETFHLPNGTWKFTVLVTGLTFAVAWLSWRYLEAPILQYKGRLFPEPRVPLVGARELDAPVASVPLRPGRVPLEADQDANCVESPPSRRSSHERSIQPRSASDGRSTRK